MKNIKQPLTILLLTAVFLPGVASANMVTGNFLGVFSGNDSESAMLSNLGITVTELAKVDWPATSNDGLELSSLIFNDDNEPTSGQWGYTGMGIVGYLVVKAGPNFAVYEYNDVITGNMPNTGLWDTSDLSNKGLSHITAYQGQASVVPVPAAVWLFGSGLIGLVGLARRKKV